MQNKRYFYAFHCFYPLCRYVYFITSITIYCIIDYYSRSRVVNERRASYVQKHFVKNCFCYIYNSRITKDLINLPTNAVSVKRSMSSFNIYFVPLLFSSRVYLTIILRNRAEYRLMLTASSAKIRIFYKIEQDNCFIVQHIDKKAKVLWQES